MIQIHPVGILAVIAVVMCWGFAWVLYRTGTPGSMARKLSLLLVVEGVTLISTGYIELFLTDSMRAHHLYPTMFQASGIIHTFGDCAMLALYPAFLAAALNTKLTRPFAETRVRIVLAVASAVLFFATLLGPLEFGATLLYLLLSLLFIFALVASIHAWRTAASRVARTRAGIYALAFGFRDICWSTVYGAAILLIWMGEYAIVDPDASSPIYVVYALGTLIAVPLIAYGILRTQLFDIDLRIRWTIKQSTIAGIFVAVFYLVSEGADRLLSSEFGSVFGLLASALVVFFLVPLQRFAERVATVTMPNTQNTPEYAAFRKLQVYESALIEALEFGGGISDKERALLNRLYHRLMLRQWSETFRQSASIERGLTICF
jgi:hypothetical protein